MWSTQSKCVILVDTSVWINHWRNIETRSVLILRQPELIDHIVVGDLILFEALQGARDDDHAQKLDEALSQFPSVAIVKTELVRAAAANYRHLRGLGTTPRRNADLLIATYCIETNTQLLHDDRDFTILAQHLPLLIY
jgi:predicted nucleic acid-binding protein